MSDDGRWRPGPLAIQSDGEFALLLMGGTGLAIGLVISTFVAALRWMPAILITSVSMTLLATRAVLLHHVYTSSRNDDHSSLARLNQNLQNQSLHVRQPDPDDSPWAFFCQGVISPELVTERIRERVEPLTRAFQFIRSYEIGVPSSKGSMYIPVMKSRKGELYDDLAIDLPGVETRRILSFAEQAELASSFFRQLISESGIPNHEIDRITEEAREVISSGPPIVPLVPGNSAAEGAALAAAPPSSTLLPGSDAPRDDRVRRILADLESQIDFERNPQLKGQVATAVSLVDELARFYVITIEIPPSKSAHGVTIVARFRKVISSQFRGTGLPFGGERILDMLRTLVAVRSSRFQILVESLYACRSYHIEVFGPRGTFLAKQSLDLHGQSGAPYIRLRRRLGQRYAHLYARGGHALRYADGSRAHIYLDLGFIERTPGSIGVVTVTSFVSLVLIWIAGRVSGGEKGVDVVALMMALPPAVSAWLQLGKEHSPFIGLMTTRVVAFSTALLSAAAAAHYLGAFNDASWAKGFVAPGVSGLYALLFSLTLLASVAGSYAWARRAILLGSMLAKEPEPLLRKGTDG